jgi:predicted Zn finger-like uncharacterized protein
MPIQIMCGRCHTSYPVDDDLRGRRVRCRECNEPLVVEGPFAATSEEAWHLDPTEAADRKVGILVSTVGQHPIPAEELVSKFPVEVQEPGAAPLAGRSLRKSRRTTLFVGIMVLGLTGLLAGTWAWDLFDMRSRWAPPSPPSILNWKMLERIGEFPFARELRVEERRAGKIILVVEVQLPRRLLDRGWEWQEWSAEFRGPDLRLETSDGQTFPAVLVTPIEPVEGPASARPPGWDTWIDVSRPVKVGGHGPGPPPDHFTAKAAFVVLRSSVHAGGFRVQYKGIPSAPVPQIGTPAGLGRR